MGNLQVSLLGRLLFFLCRRCLYLFQFLLVRKNIFYFFLRKTEKGYSVLKIRPGQGAKNFYSLELWITGCYSYKLQQYGVKAGRSIQFSPLIRWSKLLFVKISMSDGFSRKFFTSFSTSCQSRALTVP